MHSTLSSSIACFKDTLGQASVPLSSVPENKWLHRTDALVGKSMVAPAEGSLEYELMLDAGGAGGRRSPTSNQPAPPPEDLEPGMYKAGWEAWCFGAPLGPGTGPSGLISVDFSGAKGAKTVV